MSKNRLGLAYSERCGRFSAVSFALITMTIFYKWIPVHVVCAACYVSIRWAPFGENMLADH